MDQTAIPFLRQFFAKYKFALLILLVGIILMLLPNDSAHQEQEAPPSVVEEAAEEITLQDQLSALLSQVSGAGKVKVLLTEATGEKTHYQENTDTSTGEQNQTMRKDTVLVTNSSRDQVGLISQIDPPTYQGAIILCQGADQATVRLAITEAVANATGLGYNKITVLKMK